MSSWVAMVGALVLGAMRSGLALLFGASIALIFGLGMLQKRRSKAGKTPASASSPTVTQSLMIGLAAAFAGVLVAGTTYVVVPSNPSPTTATSPANNPGPTLSTTATTAANPAAGKALLTVGDFPSGWKEVAPENAGLPNLLIGGLKSCKDTAPPENGLSHKRFVAFGPSDYTAFDVQGAVNEEIGEFYGNSAQTYMDAFLSTLSKCPTYNQVTTLRDGSPLGDQVTRFQTSNIAYAGDGVMVRVGNVIIDVFRSHGGAPTDTALLDHVAEQAVNRLRGA